MQRLDAWVANSTTGPSTSSDAKVWRKIAFAIYDLRKGSEALHVDLRKRDPMLVVERDRDARVDAILLFPSNMQIAVNAAPTLLESYPDLQVKVIHLPQPRTLRDLMQALTDPAELERQAAKVEQFPVRLHTPPPTTAPSGDPVAE